MNATAAVQDKASLVVEERAHDGRHAISLGLLDGELAPSSGGDGVEPRLPPVVVGDAPPRRLPTAV